MGRLDTFRANTLVLVDNQKVAHLPAVLKMPVWVQTFGLPGYNDRLKYQTAFAYNGSAMFRSIHGAGFNVGRVEGRVRQDAVEPNGERRAGHDGAG